MDLEDLAPVLTAPGPFVTARVPCESAVVRPAENVLLRAAMGTGAEGQLVPEQLADAPGKGVGAVLRYAH